MIEAGKNYKLNNLIFLAEDLTDPEEYIFLKDLNRSAVWNNHLGKPAGYSEGYKIIDKKAVPFGFDFETVRDWRNGQPVYRIEYTIWPESDRREVPITAFERCGVETEVVDLSQLNVSH